MSPSIESIELHLSSCSCCFKTDVGQEDFGFCSIKGGDVSIVYRRFPTHVPSYVSKKGVPSKYHKVSGQSIYSGQMHPVVRAKLMSALKDRFTPGANNVKRLTTTKKVPSMKKVKLTFEYGVPVNYGDVRMIRGVLSWKSANSDYIPRWDLSNLWPMRKSIEDCLVGSGIIRDDNVGVVVELSERFVEVKHINDRYIRVIINRR